MQIQSEVFQPKASIAGTLKSLKIGAEAAIFDLSKRAVVESTASRLAKESNYSFSCRAEGRLLKVWRLSKDLASN